eukprot:CAMPEP_0119323270 /NCGR_PEP_ID=MMETSP1333-20130426/60405_1 /TAXON_ID=418940 /ORGANISM="Scyphosphaera apsteinii, Strain RCC1455" /LENGTH=492 /DNA_ID=CAMNT_0007330671 /DNA_START=170 /DNA_END=1648 /DNA_ORIENTATION=+
MDRPGKKGRLQRIFGRCKFTVDPHIEMVLSQQGKTPNAYYPVSYKVEAQSCAVPSFDERAGDWWLTKVGPFYTHGGYDWTNVFAHIHKPAVSRWATADGTVYVSDFMLASISKDNDIVGFPPIHQHHWHFSGANNMYQTKMSTHGDTQAMGFDQGKYSLLKEYNTSLRLARRFVPNRMMWAEFNDVRPAGSASLEWYVHSLAFFLKPEEPMKVEIMSWAMLGVGALNVEQSRAFTFQYDTTKQYTVWVYGAIPYMEEIIEAHWHTHQDMVEDVWFIHSTPDKLGLLEEPWAGMYWNAKSGEGNIEALKSFLDAKIESQNIWVCKRSDSIQGKIEYFDGYDQQAIPRKSYCHFDIEDHVPGTRFRYTFVSFLRPMRSGLPPTYRVHMGMQFTYRETPGNPYEMIQDTPDPSCDTILGGKGWAPTHNISALIAGHLRELPLHCSVAMVRQSGAALGDEKEILNTFWSVPVQMLADTSSHFVQDAWAAFKSYMFA